MRRLVQLCFLVVMALVLPACAAEPAAQAPVNNAEMKAMFDADQGERLAAKADWKLITANDEKRRARTREFLAQNALHTADDYWEAAFVFQHGDTADSYLLAHILAMVAVAKGKQDAIWISAATLDRYLMKIGQKQVLGTQYVRPDLKGPWTQEPYDRAFASDALRQELGVGTEAQQAEHEKQLNAKK